jgi:hypothetical protein
MQEYANEDDLAVGAVHIHHSGGLTLNRPSSMNLGLILPEIPLASPS